MTATEMAAIDWLMRQVMIQRMKSPGLQWEQPPPDLLPLIEDSILRIAGVGT